MDEFDVNDSIDTLFSDDSSMDSFESSEVVFDAMDSAEVPVLEAPLFDNIENGSIEDYSFDNTEILNNEINDIMNDVEMEELTFGDEVIEEDSVLETEALPEAENIEIASDIQTAETDIESQIRNATSIDELMQLRNQILQERLPENEYEDFTTEEYIEDKPKTLVREITPEILESRNADTEETLDNYRENLREYGVDEEAIEQLVLQERDKINAEYESLDRGDLDSNHYKDPTDWESIASRLKGDGLEEAGIERNVESADAAIEPIDPSEIDYNEVFEGLDSYDFDGVDYLQDVERLNGSLGAFQPERWQELDLDQQKEAMIELAEYVQEVTGLENPPTIEFYSNSVDGDYGGYMASTNTLSINEHMLYDSSEAADTVAHELWHAYQHERAMNPQSAKDYQYQYNFEHYISPKQDMSGRFVNFTEYQDQLVEAEARAFAEQFKGRLGGYSGAN